MRELTFAEAALEALAEEFRRDARTIYMGTGPPTALLQEFGPQRVRATPISEAAFVGAAIGLAGCGFRPVADLGMATFMFVAMDQLVNQAAKITYMFGGQAQFPIVFRVSVGAGRSLAAQHSVSPYSMFMNVPGLKIILPATPYDMKGLMKSAIRDNNPVLSFEHMAMVRLTGEVPEGDYTLPLGQARVAREGKDVTVVALARMVHETLSAAQELQTEGISPEIIDPRCLVPLDKKTIRASVAKTGRLVVVDEACATCGAAAEIMALVAEDPETFGLLKAAPRRVCAPDVPIPYSPAMERFVIPDRARIGAAVRAALGS